MNTLHRQDPQVRLAGKEDGPELAAMLKRSSRVAIDTEFHAERRFLPELFLVQLKPDIEDAPIWIVDPLQTNILAKIADALLAVPWVVHAGEQDLRVLRDAIGRLPELVFDTQIAAGLVASHWPAPYGGLVSRWLGISLEKGETLSDWSRRPLSAAQLNYAALDVDLLLPLWDRLEVELSAKGRSALARSACDEALEAANNPPDDAESMREIAAASALQPDVLLVLQELSAWRTERARATNQPMRAVLSDGALVDLARRKPLTVDALLANRRLPRSLSKEAPELVERIARAAARPLWAVPKLVRKRTPQWRSTAWLQLFGESLGERLSFGSGLVMPRSLAERLVLDRPKTRDALSEVLDWRDPLLGERLFQALQGEISLAIFSTEVQSEEALDEHLDLREIDLPRRE